MRGSMQEDYGNLLTESEVRQRILRVLGRRVLHAHNRELAGYFEMMAAQCSSPFSGSGETDAISGTSDEDLEQTALLLCHHDADGDGLLSRKEFASLVELVASQTGQAFSAEHVERCFRVADVDDSGALDLNEVLLYARRHVKQPMRSGAG